MTNKGQDQVCQEDPRSKVPPVKEIYFHAADSAATAATARSAAASSAASGGTTASRIHEATSGYEFSTKSGFRDVMQIGKNMSERKCIQSVTLLDKGGRDVKENNIENIKKDKQQKILMKLFCFQEY